jgi:predicted nuclease with TOPRIM domain
MKSPNAPAFRTAMGGYSKQDVNAYIAELSSHYEEKLTDLEGQLAVYKARADEADAAAAQAEATAARAEAACKELEQANALIEGKAVIHSGQRKDGESFSCCIQFDAARREPAISHPSWFKEAQRAGMDMAPKQKQEEKAAQQQKTSQEQSQKKSGGLK